MQNFCAILRQNKIKEKNGLQELHVLHNFFSLISTMLHMSTIMLTRLQELCKSCRVPAIFISFIWRISYELRDYIQDNSLCYTRKVDNNKIRKVLFVNLCKIYVTDMRYLEECSVVNK